MADSDIWYVYLLVCSDSSLYCGVSNRLQTRLVAHNAGKGARYTRSRLPVRLVWAEPQLDRSHALRREYEIKQFSRQRKLQLLQHPLPEALLLA